MKKIFITLITFLFFFGIKDFAFAQATIYMSPSMSNYTVGNNFTIDIRVNTGGQSINAAEASLVFNPQELNVASISKSESIFSLWTSEPVFSNSTGTIDFAGGSPTGYSGAIGKIITITFKPKTSAVSYVNIVSGAVLAADGEGTNVLGSMLGGIYTLKRSSSESQEEVVIPSTEQVAGGAPFNPLIISGSHPEEEKWYSNNKLSFNWKLPSDVTGVSLLLNDKATSNPGSTSDGLFDSKLYENIEDGTWYFHLKFKNKYGWGKITHRKVLIDTIQPAPIDFSINNGGDQTNPSPVVNFVSSDLGSGIDYYELKIGEGDNIKTEKTNNVSFKLAPLSPGNYKVDVKALDKAGNFSSASTKIKIVSIAIPQIKKYPKFISPKDKLTIEGTGISGALVSLSIQQKGKDVVIQEIQVAKDGTWSYISKDNLIEGTYYAWAQSKDKRGAISLASKKIRFWVGFSPFLSIAKVGLDWLTSIVSVFVFIAGIIAFIYFTSCRIRSWKRELKKENAEVKQSVERAFQALREEVQNQVEKFDRKPGLTKEEKAIRDKLKHSLDIAEQYINKEIERVDRKIDNQK